MIFKICKELLVQKRLYYQNQLLSKTFISDSKHSFTQTTTHLVKHPRRSQKSLRNHYDARNKEHPKHFTVNQIRAMSHKSL